MEKKVTTRKAHVCAYCDKEIPTGSQAMYMAARYPKYDKDENQVGIEYVTGWFHLFCFGNPDTECTNDNGYQGKEYREGCIQQCEDCEYYRPTQKECKHNEETRQGDGFTYTVCSKCGEDLG